MLIKSAITDVFDRVKGLTDEIAAQGDEIDKQSQKLGLSAQGYQE